MSKRKVSQTRRTAKRATKTATVPPMPIAPTLREVAKERLEKRRGEQARSRLATLLDRDRENLSTVREMLASANAKVVELLVLGGGVGKVDPRPEEFAHSLIELASALKCIESIAHEMEGDLKSADEAKLVPQPADVFDHTGSRVAVRA